MKQQEETFEDCFFIVWIPTGKVDILDILWIFGVLESWVVENTLDIFILYV